MADSTPGDAQGALRLKEGGTYVWRNETENSRLPAAVGASSAAENQTFAHCWNHIAKERVREAILKPAETFLRQAAPLGTLTGVAVMYCTPDGKFQMYVQDGDVLFDRADIQVCSVPAAW